MDPLHMLVCTAQYGQALTSGLGIGGPTAQKRRSWAYPSWYRPGSMLTNSASASVMIIIMSSFVLYDVVPDLLASCWIRHLA